MHPHLLGRETNELVEAPAGPAYYFKQKRRNARQRIIGPSKNPQVGPGVEIVLNRQQENLFVSASIPKLRTIGVLLPADVPQQFPIDQMKGNEVTAPAMVWPEDELLRRELPESALDVARPKSGAIPADGDNFVIAKLRDFFARVLKARRETSPGLAVNAGASGARASCRREQMDINRTRSFRGKGGAEKWPRRIRQRTPRQIDLQFVGEYEYGSTGHVFGYENARGRDKPFLWNATLCERRGCRDSARLSVPSRHY